MSLLGSVSHFALMHGRFETRLGPIFVFVFFRFASLGFLPGERHLPMQDHVRLLRQRQSGLIRPPGTAHSSGFLPGERRLPMQDRVRLLR